MDGVPKRWLDIDEAAAYMRLARGTLYNLVSRQEITHAKLGKRIIFDIHVLDSYMEERFVFARERARPRMHVQGEQGQAVAEVYRL